MINPSEVSKLHYYQHHIGDLLRETANLNDHQLVTYMRMIWRYYETEKPFTDSLEDLAFAMRSDEKTVQLLLRHYFVQQSDGWHQSRCDKEISAYHEKGEKRKAAANARWKDANAKQMQSNSIDFDANHKPITNNQEEKIKDNDAPPKGDAKKSDLAMLVAEGVDNQTASDFLKVRKAKRAPLTITALEGIKREAEKAGITFTTAVKICVERGWQGFRHDWAWQSSSAARSPPAQSYAAQRDAERRSTLDELTGANKRQGGDDGRVIDVKPE